MKLYLSSIDIPTPNDLAQLIGKPLDDVKVALIPNAKDYYADRARKFILEARVAKLVALGLHVTIIDLREFDDAEELKQQLDDVDLIWAMGGNTYILRYEMARSGFDTVIVDLLENGIVYGGDSAGALVAGVSISGIESADTPEFAEEIIESGMGLVPYVVLPHVDNPEFADVLPVVRTMHAGKTDLIELKDSQAVIFSGGSYRIVEPS